MVGQDDICTGAVRRNGDDHMGRLRQLRIHGRTGGEAVEQVQAIRLSGEGIHLLRTTDRAGDSGFCAPKHRRGSTRGKPHAEEEKVHPCSLAPAPPGDKGGGRSPR